MISWHIVTSDVYRNGTPIDTHMYFLSDTKEIYRGNVPFTESVIMYTDSLPISPALNKLYINSNTLEGKIWQGTGIGWITVIHPISQESLDVSNTMSPVSGKAVAAYVAAELAKTATATNTVSALSWDSAEHLLSITKGAGESAATEDIVFEGLGVSLNYNTQTGALQMLDASGNLIGDPVTLDLERFITSGEYDPNAKTIKLYFDADKTEFVEIPVGSLVDTYSAESTATLDLNVTDNKFVGNVKISTAEGNLITADENGLYVAPIDISSKMDKVVGAVEGNIATFDANGQVVDSGTAFSDIATNNSIYSGEGTVPNDVVPVGTTPAKGDFAIVKTQIAETGKYQHTAYIYNGEAWEAMDGNYSAANIFFPENLTTTHEIGNITLTNGQASVAAAGKNIVDVWNSIFVQAKDPAVTDPSVSLTFSQAKAYEVGTSVTPSYTANLNPGSYEFGPDTGIVASSWAITASDNGSTVATASTNSGSFDAIVVADGTKYKIKAVANYEAGAVPKNNLGNDVASKQIPAGSKEKEVGTITGFRKGFYGTLTDKTTELTSDVIRGLKNATTSAPVAGTKWNLDVPVGAQRIVFAYPATIRDVTDVLDKNASSAQIKSAFTMKQIDVEGANNFDAIAYKVYYQDLANANDTANTYYVTL